MYEIRMILGNEKRRLFPTSRFGVRMNSAVVHRGPGGAEYSADSRTT
jgi:hypothetical protein